MLKFISDFKNICKNQIEINTKYIIDFDMDFSNVGVGYSKFSKISQKYNSININETNMEQHNIIDHNIVCKSHKKKNKLKTQKNILNDRRNSEKSMKNIRNKSKVLTHSKN